MIGAESAVDLARAFGTPLHVIHEERLEATAARFRRSMEAAYPGRTSVHFAFKCNSVPAVIEAVRRAGLKAEVMSPLRARAGPPSRDIAGTTSSSTGRGRPPRSSRRAVESAVRLIAVDSPGELGASQRDRPGRGQTGRRPPPGQSRSRPQGDERRLGHGKPQGMRLRLRPQERRGPARPRPRSEACPASASAASIFTSGRASATPRPTPGSWTVWRRSFERRAPHGFGVDIVDVGGGFASPTTREMTSRELLVYQGLERLPAGVSAGDCGSFEDFSAGDRRSASPDLPRKRASRAHLRAGPVDRRPEPVPSPDRVSRQDPAEGPEMADHGRRPGDGHAADLL